MSASGDAPASAAMPDEATLSEADRRRQITDVQIINLSEETASDWRKIARRLPDVSKPGTQAFKLNDQRLTTIEKKSGDDEERMISVLQKWRDMRSSHTWGALWDTLYACGYGRAAKTVFGELGRDSASATHQCEGASNAGAASSDIPATSQASPVPARSQLSEPNKGTPAAASRNQLLKVIDRLSQRFEDRSLCESLATHLEVTTESRDFVQAFRMQNSTEQGNYPLIAKVILKEWFLNSANMQTDDCLEHLCKVLREDVEREDLSDKCLQWWEHYAQATAS